MKKILFFTLFIFSSYIIFSQDQYAFCNIPFGSSKLEIFNALSSSTALVKDVNSESENIVTYYGPIFGKNSLVTFYLANKKLAAVAIDLLNAYDVQSYIDVENQIIKSYGTPKKSVVTYAKEDTGERYFEALTKLKDEFVASKMFASSWDEKEKSIITMRLTDHVNIFYLNIPLYQEFEKIKNGETVKF